MITELAMIMKGLGCVSAVNFDGGGSTTMICEGKRLNSEISNWAGDKTENRAVKSTMGFLQKINELYKETNFVCGSVLPVLFVREG